MFSRLNNHVKNLLLPCVIFSVAAGILSAIIVTLFKLAAEEVIHLSSGIYAAVRTNPVWIPVLILGAAVIGLIASFILSSSHSCRGGGIPTSVAAIRGIVSFNWIKTVILLPFSALLTYLCGVPLGTEGPCVQMGTAIGDGIIKCCGGKKHTGWRRYIMTGGASAGFSIATGSPVTAILFAVEELHKQFSPLLLTIATLCVTAAQITTKILASFGIGSDSLFHIAQIEAIAPKFFFAPLLVGLVCGVCSILFTRFYHLIDDTMHALLKKVSVKVVLPILFACIALVGFFLSDTLGTGHGLVDELFHSKTAWYMLVLVFLIRTAFMMLSNTSGTTGGIFLPTLAFGAIIGSLCATAMTAFGWVSHEHYLLIVVLGITAFLGSTSRIPITACVFAMEALGGIYIALPLIIATIVALLTVEMSGLEDFTDTVVEAKMRAIRKGKQSTVIVAPLTVSSGSFAIGKQFRDILWPDSCVVVSFERAPENYGCSGIGAGDVITVRYKTYNPEISAREFSALVGEQSKEINDLLNPQL